MGDDALLGAVFTQVPGKRSSVQTFDTDNLRRLQVAMQALLTSPIAVPFTRLLDHKAFSPDTGRLDVLRRDPVVTDVRRGHGDDLSFIGRIRQHFLVARHCRIEDHLADGLPFKPKRAAFEDCSVRQGQPRLSHARIPSCCKDRLVLSTSNQIPSSTFTTYNDRMAL